MPDEVEPARPVCAALAVVVRGGDVLLVRRANRPDAGLWGYPGGKIEAGETIAAAALRELREETGVRAEAAGVVTALDALDRAPGGALRHHYVMVAVLCRWLSGEPVAADDAEEARWFAVAALPAMAAACSEGVAGLAGRALSLAGRGGEPA